MKFYKVKYFGEKVINANNDKEAVLLAKNDLIIGLETRDIEEDLNFFVENPDLTPNEIREIKENGGKEIEEMIV
jgi:hypothetical protein